MKRIAFILTMPNNNSWNGKWSGDKDLHVIIKNLSDKYGKKVLLESSYYYNFGDGWSASIEVKEIDGLESRALRKRNSGFCGYDWMVSSIISNGEIRC
jgi:hypothetical protein